MPRCIFLLSKFKKRRKNMFKTGLFKPDSILSQESGIDGNGRVDLMKSNHSGEVLASCP